MKNKLQVLIPTDTIRVCNVLQKIQYKENSYSTFLGFVTDVISDVVLQEGYCNLNSVNFDRKDIDDYNYWIIEFEIELCCKDAIKYDEYELKRILYRNNIQQIIIDILTNLK